jgi:preprotein translocase subunit SecE
MQIKNIFLWALISLLSLGTLIMQFYVNLSPSIHNIVWGLWLFLSIGFFLLTEKGIAFKVFAKDSINEVKKVVWPTKQETIQTTMIVIIMVAVTGVILWMLDNLMIWLIARLAHLA